MAKRNKIVINLILKSRTIKFYNRKSPFSGGIVVMAMAMNAPLLLLCNIFYTNSKCWNAEKSRIAVTDMVHIVVRYTNSNIQCSIASHTSINIIELVRAWCVLRV